MSQDTKTASNTKQEHEKLTFEAGRNTWYIKDNKIYARHKVGEILRVPKGANSNGK